MISVGLPPLDDLFQLPNIVNEILMAYVQFCYDQELPVSRATFTLAGVQFKWPSLRYNLTASWRVLKKWQELMPPVIRTPVPEVVMRAIVATAVALGWPSFGLLVWLAFHALLRPGEVCALRRGHLRLTCDCGSDQVGVVALTTSKTSTRSARIQSVMITDVWLLGLLNAYFGNWPALSPLCSGGSAAFSRRFLACLDRLGLKNRFMPAGLRGGGAVHHFEIYENLGSLQFRGRWEAPRTLLHYLQQGMATTSFLGIHPVVRCKVESMAALAMTLLEGAVAAERPRRPPPAGEFFESISEASVSDEGGTE